MGRNLENTLKPQIHFISGNLLNSVLDTSVPHRKQEYKTSNFSSLASGVVTSLSTSGTVSSDMIL